MLGIAMLLRRPLRKCAGLARRLSSPPIDTVDIDPNEPMVDFLCNVCGTENRVPRRRISREGGHCQACRCYSRLRSMVYALTTTLFDEPVLARVKSRKDLRGIGCSDWGYGSLETLVSHLRVCVALRAPWRAAQDPGLQQFLRNFLTPRSYVPYLSETFNYVNTFYDRQPQLDLCNIDWKKYTRNSIDFITCTDVLEHVEPPVDRAFAGMAELLRPGGIAVLTVPSTLKEATLEHFPNLAEWRIAEEDGQRVLVNHRRDGKIERFDDLCFHGGEGATLEFRRFSRQGFIRNIEDAGLRVERIFDEPVDAHGIALTKFNYVLVARKP